MLPYTLGGRSYIVGEMPPTLRKYIDKTFLESKGTRMKPSGQLLDFLERTPLPWLKYDTDKQKLIMIVDNHLLSTYRACPQHFVYAHIQGLRRKAVQSEKIQRNWFLDFGICLHKMLEMYYRHFRESGFDTLEFMTVRGCEEWRKMEMDIHSEHKEFKLIGGVHGFIALLVQYATVLSPLNEHIRVLGTEVSFGRNLEVPLWIAESYEVYLAGRMDMIVDDGYFICPLDHKTMGTFRGDPGLRFETDEGPTGYIYALKTVLPQFVSEGEILKRDCSKILMNLISKTPTPDPRERFKRIQIRKTTQQLEDYRQRMVNTAEHLLLDMQIYVNDFALQRNTQVCQNWMHLQCTYFDLCRQQSTEGVEATTKNGFIQVKLWDTEAVEATV